MTVLAPPILLKVYVSSVSATASWPADGSTYAGYPYKWSVTMTVTAQSTSYPSSSTPYYYNGNNITAGMWMSNEVGGAAWQILSITSATATNVTCVIEDVAQYNTYNDPTGTGSGGPSSLVSGFVFTVNSGSVPILSAVTPNVLTSQWQTDTLSRFAYVNPSSGSGSGLPTTALPSVAVGSLYGTTGSNAAAPVTVGTGLSLSGGVLTATGGSGNLSTALPAVAVGSLYGTTGSNAAEAVTVGIGLSLSGGVLSATGTGQALNADGVTIVNTNNQLSVVYGTAVNTAAEGNDSRIVNALSTSVAAATYATIASVSTNSIVNALIFG